MLIPKYFGDRRYEVVYVSGEDVLVDVHIRGSTGAIIEVWTGPQAETLLARGYDPPIGRSLNRPYIWLTLAALFLAPFVDVRRPFRLLHLDLAVLLGFGISLIFFNRGQVDLSVPAVYPLLLYLLARMLLAGFRPREARGRLLPVARPTWLFVGLVVLVAFRVGLNLVDSHAIDVGQQSVFGADRIQRGEPLYSSHGDQGDDAYGPIVYLAYVPFEALFPADGPGGYERAARAAAITFDLLVIGGLLLLGRRLRTGAEGRALGIVLAYAWAAYPFSTYALQANTNDTLVAALLVFALLAIASAPGRGVLLGLAGAAKFAPLALVPLFARGRRRGGWRSVTIFAVALAGTVATALLAYLPEDGLRELYDSTVGYQLERESPLSLWGLHPSLAVVQDALKVACLIFIAVLALIPARPSDRQLAALAAGVLLALQLCATYWFYTYLVWFVPLALAATLAAYPVAPPSRVHTRPLRLPARKAPATVPSRS